MNGPSTSAPTGNASVAMPQRGRETASGKPLKNTARDGVISIPSFVRTLHNPHKLIFFSPVFLAFVLLALLAVPAMSSSVGTEGAAFLEIPVGAGPSALGGAYTAVSTDAYAPVYNPAGLAGLEDMQASAQHLAYLENVYFEEASLAYPMSNRQGLGLAVQYLGSGSSDRTDENGVANGKFSDYFAAANFSYGVRPGGPVSFGVTGKIIQGKLDKTRAIAYAADVGALYRANRWLDVGAVVANLGTDIKFIDQKDPLPTAGKLGLALHPAGNVLVTVDGVYDRAESLGLRGGVEWRAIDMFALRAGYRSDIHNDSSSGLTAGMGLRFGKQEISYAWLPLGKLGSAHYFSLLWHFSRSSIASPAVPEL